MSKPLILIIEDDPDIRELLAYALDKENFDVRQAESAEDGFKILKETKVDLILLDLMLPSIDGFEFLKRIRVNDAYRNISVIIVSAKGDESDIVKGLTLGAEDYISKPFSPRVLIARVQSNLRRKDMLMVESENSNSIKKEIIEVKNFVFNLPRHELRVDGKLIDLSATEFAILEYLTKSAGRVFTRSQIITGIRGGDYPVTERAIDVQILSIRKKLGKNSEFIETVRGIGYRFKD